VKRSEVLGSLRSRPSNGQQRFELWSWGPRLPFEARGRVAGAVYRRPEVTGRQVVILSTRNGARAMGRLEDSGTLEPGCSSAAHHHARLRHLDWPALHDRACRDCQDPILRCRPRSS
jgi:cytosine/adenosine deaminase-related metal-dependent hydrolase